jgi:TonB family protein
MYFDFDDYRPDVTGIGSVISWREGVLLSIIVHLALVIALLLLPRYFPEDSNKARERMLALAKQLEEQRKPERFVFVQPREDLRAPAPPPRAEASDQDRQARTRERAERPTNPMPRSRGNTTERLEAMERETARGRGPEPDPALGQQARAEPDPTPPAPQPSPESLTVPDVPGLRLPSSRAPANSRLGGGSLGDALRNLQRYVETDQFNNPQGGSSTFGPAIQFDTKGVEFGPWIRRFVAQVKRNWLIPNAAMMMKGHVMITFNVHKDGHITDLAVVKPSSIDAFNNAAYGALASSNPTVPLPPEYPSDKAFFTVTFFYNEEPQ